MKLPCWIDEFMLQDHTQMWYNEQKRWFDFKNGWIDQKGCRSQCLAGRIRMLLSRMTCPIF